jgi:hypothetical protein
MADHAFALAEGWRLWRWACLRSAGFPAGWVGRLAAPKAGLEVEAFFASEEGAGAARAEALAICPPGKLKKQLRRGCVEASGAAEAASQPQLAAAVDRCLALQRAADEQRARAEQAFAAEVQRAAMELREIARLPRFREAVLWQNRHAVHTGLDPLLRTPLESRDSNTRRHEQLVANYLQRYCTKNDTIGFFGPVGWARLGEGSSLVSAAGPSLLESRRVYFEYWAIDALAARLSDDEQLLPWLRPRRLPSVWVEGLTVHHPPGATSEVDPLFARLLQKCDGTAPARAIAAALLSESSLELSDADEIYQLLRELVERRLITWGVDLPTHDFFPERRLRSELTAIDEVAVREAALRPLDELEACRAELERAAGDPERLDGALSALESCFQRHAGRATSRGSGETYAGRGLVFEDCRRATTVSLGSDLLQGVAPALALVLVSARWFSYEIAVRYRRSFEALFDRLAAGRSAVDYGVFFAEARPLFPGGATPGSTVAEVADELARRWRIILELPEGAGSVTRESAALRERVMSQFAAPHPGWPAARHHSPDLMIVWEEAPLFVLGEMHAGLNSVCSPALVKEHPRPEELIEAREADLPGAGVAPVWSKDMIRSNVYSLSRHDFDLENGLARSPRPPEQVLTVGRIEVARQGSSLVARTIDGARSFDLIAFLEQHLIAESLGHFSLLGARSGQPRVTIDRLVVARQSWSFKPDELAFASLGDPWARFVGAREWQRRNRLPRHLFYKVPEETKPCYLDVIAPTYVETFARTLRKASRVTCSEMLPRADQLWLRDGEGNTYTSELRIAAVDPVAWRPPDPEQ